jgi:alpha-galactosidase/6-phospho-beta-glucosidase family protein
LSEDDLHIDLCNLWKAKTVEEEQIFDAIRNSDIFSPKRIETFIKFNYRTVENKNINYESTFKKLLSHRNGEKDGRSCRGTMHISELWS